ncbi:MAG: L-histidine N(alpha)-methyltransferase, partial [Myxococcota bacterium]
MLECLEARQIPSALLYDARGCFLFEEITRCREYYLTRTEMGLLRRAGSELAHAMAGADIIELGSGSCEKISVLLEAASLSGHVGRYIPIDVSESSIDESARALRRLHPNLVVQGIAADFFSGLERIPDGSRRLFCFLGSTLGNLRERERAALYHAVSRRMRRGETFLLGIDLVKDPGVIEAAYNDSAGVTAAFNLNVLNAINRLAGTDLDPKRFRHVAFYDQE